MNACTLEATCLIAPSKTSITRKRGTWKRSRLTHRLIERGRPALPLLPHQRGKGRDNECRDSDLPRSRDKEEKRGRKKGLEIRGEFWMSPTRGLV